MKGGKKQNMTQTKNITLSEKIQEFGSKAGRAAGNCLALALVAGTLIGVNYVGTAAYNGIERAVGAKTKTENMVLERKDYQEFVMGSAYGAFNYGTFRDANGNKTILTDSVDLLSGKFSANKYLSEAQTGMTYKVTSLEGALSAKILNMQQQ